MAANTAPSEPRQVRCVVVGDASVGKTRLLITIATKSFSGPYIPEPFAKHSCIVMEKGDSATILELQDTAWQDDKYHLRASYYCHADAILVCYSVTNPNSLRNVIDKWNKELKDYFNKQPVPPLILIGTKTDLRTGSDIGVTTDEGAAVGEEIGAAGSFECSAMLGEGVDEIVGWILRIGGQDEESDTTEVVRSGTGKGKKGKKGCCGKQGSSVEGDEMKCVLVGDASVGKTRLMISYTTNSFDGTYVPEPFRSFSKDVTVDGKEVCLHLQHTSWRDEDETARTLHYTDADLIFICFSLTNEDSYNNVKSKWLSEIQENYEQTHTKPPPIALLGTKVDSREGAEVRVSRTQGVVLAKEVGAVWYMECSAVTGLGVSDVFEEGVREVLRGRGGGSGDGGEVCGIGKGDEQLVGTCRSD